MKTFTKKDKQSVPVVRKARPYVHHPKGTVQQAQETEIRSILRSSGVQAKLIIRQPNDKYEQEADRVADQVLTMPDPKLQRQPVSEEDEKEEALQTKGNGDPSTTSSSVESGISSLRGNGQPLPVSTRDFFEPRIGADFSNVRVHTGSKANMLARSLKSRAFTLGKDVVFGANEYKPDRSEGRRLMAHELTHVVQQGRAGKAIQRYTEYDASDQTSNKSLGWKHPSSDDIKVADDGTLVTEDSASKDKAWALITRIVHAERILASVDSGVKLEEGPGEIKGKAPKKGKKGKKRKLKEVKLVNRVGGGRANLPANCGSAARQILGIGSPSEKFSAVTRKKGRGVEKYAALENYLDDPTRPEAPTEPWVEDILKNELGAPTAAEARRRYEALPETDPKREKIDRKYGLNAYAVPRVGQAVTAHKASGWNFHFAGAILKGGHDYVTAENYPGAGNTSLTWWFDMYGPKSKGQTFYQTWTGGPSTVAMVVESEKARKGKTTRKGVYLVRNPSKWKTTKKGVLPSGTHVDVIMRGWKWRKVEVKTGVHTGKVGWIMSRFYTLR